MTLHNSAYKHWEGAHHGIWRRRWAIAQTGLRDALQIKMMRYLLGMCWSAAFILVALLFFLGQLLIADSIVIRFMQNLNPQIQALGGGLINWLIAHPEISVHSTHNLLFYFSSTLLLPLSVVALMLTIPVLITRDRAARATIIYASKAITLTDYVLGKLGIVLGVLGLTWMGPLCFAWFFGNLLATDWHFFWHSRHALAHTLLFGGISSVVLGFLALGVSAISTKEKFTTSMWVLWWILGGTMVEIGYKTKPWLKFVSFHYNLDQIALAIFDLGRDIAAAQENLPFFGEMLKGIPPQTMQRLGAPELQGALIGLGVMLALALVVLARKIKPE